MSVNAPAESFSAAIKGELPDLQPWPAKVGARRAIIEYIAWHNGTRRHSTLGYRCIALHLGHGQVTRVLSAGCVPGTLCAVATIGADAGA